MRKTGTIALATGIAFCGLAFADDVALPGSGATAATNAAPVQTPTRGATMSKVEAQFGAPTQRLEAIGKPPITRWEYPGFVVYFEHERVVHAVVR
jgi:hypothetical protein